MGSQSLAQCALKYDVAVAASRGLPTDMVLDWRVIRPASRSGFAASDFEMLANQVREWELRFSKLGEIVLPEFSYRTLLTASDYGQIKLRHVAVITQPDGRTVTIPDDMEVVNNLFVQGFDRPLSERVSVATYLVCLSAEIVSRFGVMQGTLCYSIGALRFLIGQNSDQQGTYTGNPADDSSRAADDTDQIHEEILARELHRAEQSSRQEVA